MKVTSVIKLGGLAALFVVFSGCMATAPVMSEKFDAQAEQFQPERGKANIYVTRANTFAGSAILFTVYLNGKVQGTVAPGTYLLFEVKPGSHSIGVITQENADTEKVIAKAGNNYYYEVRPKMGWVAARAVVDTIEETKGRQLVIDGDRVELMTP